MQLYETLKEAGYVSIQKIGDEYELTDKKGKVEVFVANKNHSGWGIKYKNTHLEFCYTRKDPEKQ